uniref:Uncharacterized protein n=1 Tax=Arundo donax TaxID=35708 RepID=A0A0A9C6S9_ARUDO
MSMEESSKVEIGLRRYEFPKIWDYLYFFGTFE